MNKIAITVLILALAGAGAFIYTRQNQQAAQLEQQIQLKKAAEAKSIAAPQEKQRALAEQAKQKALEEAKKIEAEAQKAKQIAMEEAQKAEEAAKQKAAELQTMLSGLIAQAKAFLDSGKFQEAIDMAKNILSQDPNNPEAKSILDQAMAKLKEVAQEKAASLITEDSSKALGPLTTGLGNQE